MNDSISRLQRVLRGRKPYPWGESVALSRGAIARLLKGQFPDPVKLVPACRVEGLSLSWWLDGLGAPYITTPALSDADGARIATELLIDEPDRNLLIVHAHKAWCPVLWQWATAISVDGQGYSYCAATVISGTDLGPITLDALSGTIAARQVAHLPPDDLGRLMSGQMGQTELLGSAPDKASPLLTEAKPLDLSDYLPALGTDSYATALSVREASPDTHWRFPDLSTNGLSPADRDAIEHLIRRLRDR